MKSGFNFSVLKEVSKIPRGSVCSYSEIAERIGRAGSDRAVGATLRKNKKPVLIPCHRVIRKDGCIGGYSRGVKEKIKLLKSEGVKITKVNNKWKIENEKI
ncbi:MAG: MGMT family protein [bacterium]